MLGLIVNVCLQVVGALLVNALLIVPAATAANFARNMRQLFWGAILLGSRRRLAGIAFSWEVQVHDPLPPHRPAAFGQGGVIVVINVLLFVVSMVLGPRWKSRVTRRRLRYPKPANDTPTRLRNIIGCSSPKRPGRFLTERMRGSRVANIVKYEAMILDFHRDHL